MGQSPISKDAFNTSWDGWEEPSKATSKRPPDPPSVSASPTIDKTQSRKRTDTVKDSPEEPLATSTPAKQSGSTQVKGKSNVS